MAKRGQQEGARPRFRDVWATQTQLGQEFNLSAVAIGKRLVQWGLRGEDKRPTEGAIRDGFCHAAPLRDGQEFYLWHRERIRALLQAEGLAPLTRDEQEAREIAQSIVHCERHPEDPLADKMIRLTLDDTPRRLFPLVNRFLAEAGSTTRLSEE